MNKFKIALIAGLAAVAFGFATAQDAQAQIRRPGIGVRVVAPRVAPVRRIATAPVRVAPVRTVAAPVARVATAPVRVAAPVARVATTPVRVVAPRYPVVRYGAYYGTSYVPAPIYTPTVSAQVTGTVYYSY